MFPWRKARAPLAPDDARREERPAGSPPPGRRTDVPALLDLLGGPAGAAVGAELLLEDDLGGIGLPVKIFDVAPGGAAGAPLVFVFHGAFDQSRRSFPSFAGQFIGREAGRFATVIGLADPALALAPELKLTWFAASAAGDTPARIRALVAALVGRLTPARVVFTGGSAGAYPALLHAYSVPGAVAVVVNPRMRIRPSRYWSEYARFCWPEGTPTDVLRRHVPNISAIRRSSAAGDTRIVYLLNALDPISQKQAAGFLGRLDRIEDVLVVSGHWPGMVGHIYPQPEWAAWIRAAAEAPGTRLVDLADHKATGGWPAVRSSPLPETLPEPTGEADLRLAALLATEAE